MNNDLHIGMKLCSVTRETLQLLINDEQLFRPLFLCFCHRRLEKEKEIRKSIGRSRGKGIVGIIKLQDDHCGAEPPGKIIIVMTVLNILCHNTLTFTDFKNSF